MSDPGFAVSLTTDETSLGFAPTLSEYAIKVMFTPVFTHYLTQEGTNVQYPIKVVL